MPQLCAKNANKQHTFGNMEKICFVSHLRKLSPLHPQLHNILDIGPTMAALHYCTTPLAHLYTLHTLQLVVVVLETQHFCCSYITCTTMPISLFSYLGQTELPQPFIGLTLHYYFIDCLCTISTKFCCSYFFTVCAFLFTYFSVYLNVMFVCGLKLVKYVLSSPWDSEKRNFNLFVCLAHVKKLTIKLTLTLTLIMA